MTILDRCIIKESDSFYIDIEGKDLAEFDGIREGDTIRFRYEDNRYIGTVKKFDNEEKDLFILKNVISLK